MKVNSKVTAFLPILIVFIVGNVFMSVVDGFDTEAYDGLEITHVEYIGTDKEGNKEYLLKIKNNGTVEESYPEVVISNEAEDGYYMYVVDRMFPEEYYDPAVIPGSETAEGIYTLDMASYEDLRGGDCIVKVNDDYYDDVPGYEYYLE